MDDLDNDIRRTIDDAVDDAELLPFRYTRQRGLSDIYATLMPRSCEGRSRRAVNVNTTVNNPSQLVWDVLYGVQNRSQRWLHLRPQSSTQTLRAA
jgi:hypothetical protein